jgi:geranylgeranyl pyrophosphate synthase
MTQNLKEINIKDFFTKSQNDVEKKIINTITDEDIVKILKGGKRLRPLLSLLSYKVCTGGRETPADYQRALEGTVSIELAHTASLLHDDIIDEDITRRGKPSLYTKKGIPHAILKGHKMLSTGFGIAINHGEKIGKLYVNTWDEVLTGQIKEVDFNTEKDEEEEIELKGFTTKSKIYKLYKQIIDQKTAALFASSCKAGAYEANANGQIAQTLSDYGREIGIAYQLADDLVDLEEGEMIGSVVIPLLTRLENKKVDENNLTVSKIRSKIENNEEKIKKMYLKEIKKHVRNAEKLSKSDIIPNSPFKKLLSDQPSFVINMMLKKINMNV